tara:strand:- start:337 stop:654 length:318 start_codon:yes stop_codon:yes gene_type:complete
LERKLGGKFHLKLNIGSRPIANKYHEGKVKRTLKRELKVPEIAEREANGTSVSWHILLHANVMACCFTARVAVGFDLDVCGVVCLVCQRRFGLEENSRDMVIWLR